MPAPPASSSARSAAAALAGGLGGLLLTGPALPLGWGAAPVIAAIVLALGLGRWRAAGLSEAAAGGPAWRRVLIAATIVLPAIVVVAAAARTIAGLCVAVPPAIAAVGAAVVLAPLLRRARGLALVAAALVLVAAVLAARFEAAGPGARGFAHTGPILGIHPFQTTAIVIDGYGPFDLPINDYVEPDGSRGYGPEALAEALQRDLAAIAEQQFADGPARAYAAFAGARVEAVDLPGIQERLDRPAEAATEPRLIVWSGTTGWRSRVEFVCPGQRSDPRPREADDVMDRMCPDKYSSEASAGLGVTGRWTGYTEGRGLARPSLAPLFGSRTDDVAGQVTLRWEQRVWGWLVLLALVPAALWSGVAHGLARVGAALLAASLAVLGVMVVWTWPSVQVGWSARATPWASPWSPALWSPALALVLAASVGRRGAAAPAALLGLVGWAAAGALAASVWLRPGLSGVPGEALALGLGESLHGALGIDLAVAEAIAAAVVVVGLLGLLAALLGPAIGLAGRLLRPRDGAGPARWLGLGVLLAAGLILLSRKTVGGLALLTPALALGLVAVTGLAVTGVAAAAQRGRWLRAVDHLLAVALAVWAALEARAQGSAWVAAQPWTDRSNPLLDAALVLGVIAAAASLALLAGPRAVRSPSQGSPNPTDG